MHFGSARMHPFTNQAGAELTVLDVAPSRQEIERRIASVSAGRFRRPVLVLGIDGASVPTRPDSAREPCEGRRGKRAQRARWRGPWRDAKGFRFSLMDGERIVHVLSWHQVHNEEQLGEALKQIKEAGVIPEEQVRLCVVCDGAEWRGKHVQAWFPQARQVLDSSHGVNLSERVTPPARLQNRACDFRRTRLLDVFCLVMQHGPRDGMVTVSVEQLEVNLFVIPVVTVHMVNL
jgi:hypothetical protein